MYITILPFLRVASKYQTYTKMPPIPVECVEYPVAKRSRTRLNFGEPVKGTSLCTSRIFSEMTSSGMNALLHENVETQKTRTCALTKRSLETVETTPTAKRTRHHFYTSTPKSSLIESATETLSPVSSIISAVERLSTKVDLIADGSRENILPTIPGKHSDLSAISPETMSAILNGCYDNVMDSKTIIDCRYPYEFEGGHIKGAINLYTKAMVEQFLKETGVTANKTHVLIFHCEFSSERGPKMYRFLRSLDRQLNKDCYPRLNFPEIYILENGYKAFYYDHKEQCFPQSYKPMFHKDNKDELRHFRVKSKSWSAGEKTRKTPIAGTGLRLRF